MEWFSDYGQVTQARREASPETRFSAFTLTQNGNDDIQAEINRVQAETVDEEEKAAE